MKNIVIVGAGGFGREVFNYVQDCIDCGADWKIRGFIDDNERALENYNYPAPIISSIKSYVPESDDFCICAIGSPLPKKEIVENLTARGVRFEKLIHPSAYVGKNVSVGEGAVICPRVTLTCDLKIGNFAMINCATACGHDSSVGDYCVLSSFCDVTGHCKVGTGVFFASRVSMRPSSKVGDWARVGLGSCVVLNVKPNMSVFGNPAVAIL